MTAPDVRHESHSCGCVGPQGGQPLCPCRMRGLKVVDGRWVEVIDHGPAVEPESADDVKRRVMNEGMFDRWRRGLFWLLVLFVVCGGK